MKRTTAIFTAGLLLACAAHADARRPSATECHEASEFVTNAAHARGNGMSRADFIARFDADVQAIKAFRPELRWFVQDEEDERLLRAAVERVFDAPAAPEEHGTHFRALCLRNAGQAAEAG